MTWNFVVVSKSGVTFFTWPYWCMGTFFCVGHPYELKKQPKFAIMYFQNQIYVLWCEIFCSPANPVRLFSTDHIYVLVHFFCGQPLWVEKASNICYNVFSNSNIWSVMWNFVLARKSGLTIFNWPYFRTGKGHYFCGPPLWV